MEFAAGWGGEMHPGPWSPSDCCSFTFDWTLHISPFCNSFMEHISQSETFIRLPWLTTGVHSWWTQAKDGLGMWWHSGHRRRKRLNGSPLRLGRSHALWWLWSNGGDKDDRLMQRRTIGLDTALHFFMCGLPYVCNLSGYKQNFDSIFYSFLRNMFRSSHLSFNVDYTLSHIICDELWVLL